MFSLKIEILLKKHFCQKSKFRPKIKQTKIWKLISNKKWNFGQSIWSKKNEICIIIEVSATMEIQTKTKNEILFKKSFNVVGFRPTIKH